MDEINKLTGRNYKLFDYYGAPDATEVVVVMGSGAETARETVDYLNDQGRKVGMVPSICSAPSPRSTSPPPSPPP